MAESVKTPPPEFVRAAGLILDALEEAFGIVAPHGRQLCEVAIIDILDYYTIPRDLCSAAMELWCERRNSDG